MAVGTGAALEIGKRGDADVFWCTPKNWNCRPCKRAPSFQRHDVMYNDFVVIGPANDPLKLKGTKSAVEAFQKIAAAGAPSSPGVTNRDPHQGAGRLEGRRPRPQRPEVVPGGGDGHGKDPAPGQ